VAEHDADVLVGGSHRAGFVAALKFNAFPERDYRAAIRRVRSAAEMVDGHRCLVAEGEVDLPDGPGDGLRPGMTGRARIDAGPRPIVSILLRRPYRFIRSLFWL